MLIYLADLSHTGQLVASNTFPLGIGLIGANIRKEIPDAEVELFKYPTDLDHAIQRRIPDVVGFANYSWNCYLGMAFAKRIKAQYPGVVVIAGGPNYGSTDEEHEDWWARFGSFVDFYVYKEGEKAVVELIRSGFSESTGSTHFLDSNGQLLKNPLLPRIEDLDLLPSPYTTGLMDKFFDGILIPLMHTTRGCPFSCSFCTEGTAYYNKVAKRSTLMEDLTYVGQRKGTLQDLYLSDANVGMFREDKDKARAIAKTQAEYGWPKYIHCSAGKNHKERVLEFAATVGGNMGVAASIQSSDAVVLANIRRSNISVAELTGVAKSGSRIDANTYAEIILNLPGDTVEAHTQSLRDSVNAGLSYLRMYQLILLPETDLNTRETRERFGMKTMWRIMPRCFGTYTYDGEEFNVAEVEEICVAQDSMSFEDYVECRELDLTVEIVHNSNCFRELQGLCRVVGIEWFELVLGFHRRRADPSFALAPLYDEFRENTIKPLWANREEALAFASGHLDLYLTEQAGTNELFHGKAKAFFVNQEQVHDAMYAVAKELLPQFASYCDEARQFSLMRKGHLLDMDRQFSARFSYDFPALLECDFEEDPEKFRRDMDISFRMADESREWLGQLIRQYGTTTTGLGRILLRVHIKKLFRHIAWEGQTTDRGFENNYRRASNLAGD